jgi:hypothetical protein
MTSGFDLRDHPFQGAGGAVGHDKGGAHPEVIDVGADELPGASKQGRMSFHWV